MAVTSLQMRGGSERCGGGSPQTASMTQAHTAQDDQEVEQFNQSHKAKMGGCRGHRKGRGIQPRLLDLSILTLSRPPNAQAPNRKRCCAWEKAHGHSGLNGLDGCSQNVAKSL